MQENDRKLLKNAWWLFPVTSLLLHALFGLFMYIPALSPPKQVTEWEVELIEEKIEKLLNDQDDEEHRKIVQQNEKSLNDETPDEDFSLSKNNQKVLKQTKATKTGAFKNASHLKAATKSAPNKSKKDKHAKKFVTNESEFVDIELGEKKKLKDITKNLDLNKLKPSIFPSSGSGGSYYTEESQSDDYLKDIEDGTQTLLNTREFVYYSYYQRIRRKLHQYWEPNIRAKITKILRQGRRLASTGDKITKLVITLDSRGTLTKIQLKNESGYTDLDDAAIEAFQSAAPFPNPPGGIVEKDGSVKIRWNFILES